SNRHLQGSRESVGTRSWCRRVSLQTVPLFLPLPGALLPSLFTLSRLMSTINSTRLLIDAFPRTRHRRAGCSDTSRTASSSRYREASAGPLCWARTRRVERSAPPTCLAWHPRTIQPLGHLRVGRVVVS